jgi:predicted RNA-binding Zn-ribbon protein involved in translation (DUF1610 family)
MSPATSGPDTCRYCPECGAIMALARVTPKFLVLPELHSYKCPRCGNVITWEVAVDSCPH